MHELPLLIFTLFLQGSVGVTCWLAFGSTPKVGVGVMRQRVFLLGATAFVMACIGLLASTLHMGYPLNALHALRHFASSWLSREIIFASLYLACLGLALLLMLVKTSGWKVLLIAAALIGLVDVFCMAQIYIHTAIVTWQHFYTLVLFFGSVGIVGSTVIAFADRKQAEVRRSRTLYIAGVVVALVVLVRLIVQPLWLASIAATDASIVTLPHDPLLMLEQLKHFHLLGMCLCVVGMLIFTAGCIKHKRGAIVTGCFGLIVAEIMLRYVFFSIG